MDAAAFLELLEKSQLLSTEQLTIARVEAKADGISVEELTSSLIQRRWLTKWQRKMLLAGKTLFHLGKYKLLSELGRGGMGSVYKAEQTNLKRVVALKMMAPQLLKDQGAVARFHREIQAAAALNHPNIVAAYDADCVQDTHILVMEYAEGETLNAVLHRRKTLPVPEACEYIRQAALGLQHAHERGMVHRDIKPANLVLTIPAHEDDGESTVPENPKPVVKILDMGLARFSSETAETGELTHSGQIMGTPDYIAPEQAQNTRTADIRSDIFSLGCTLFRMLTGALPYGGNNTMEKLMARSLNDAPRVRSLQPDVSPELDAVVAKMLARAPAARYQSPIEVARELSTFAAPFSGCTVELVRQGSVGKGEPTPFASSAPTPASGIDAHALVSDSKLKTLAVGTAIIGEGDTRADEWLSDFQVPLSGASATNLGRPKPGQTWSPGPREIAIAATAVVVLLVIAVGMWIWQVTGQSVVELNLAPADRVGVMIEVDGRATRISGTGPVRFVGSPGKRTVRLSRPGYETVGASFDLDRGEVRPFQPRWTPTAETLRTRDFVSLGQRVASAKGQPPTASGLADLRKDLHRWRFRSPTPAERQKLSDWPRELTWPLDLLDAKDVPEFERGMFATASPSTTATLVGVFGTSRLKSTGPVLAAEFSSDAEALWTCSEDGCIVRWNASDGLPQHSVRVITERLFAATFSPDRTRLFGCHDAQACGWDTTTGRQTAVFPVIQGRKLRTDAAGTLLISGDARGGVQAWDLTLNKELWNLPGEEERVLDGITVSEDGRRVSTACWYPRRDPPWLLSTYDGRNGQLLDSVPMTTATHRLELTPDGRHLVRSADQQVLLYEADNLKAEPTALSSLDDGLALEISREGHRAAIGRRRDGRIEICDLTTRTLEMVLETGQPNLLSLTLSADGQRLATLGHDRSLSVWDIHGTPQRVSGTTGDTGGVHSAIVSAAGHVLISAAPESLTLWDVATRTERHRLPRTLLTFSLLMGPDAETLCAPADGRMARWDLNSLTPQRDLTLPAEAGRPPLNWVFSAVFRPDGKAIAATDYSWHMTEWSLPGESVRRHFPGPGHSATYSPEGTYLAAVGEGRFFVWNEVAREPIGRYGEGIERAAFSFTEGHLLTSTWAGRIESWNVPEFTLREVTTAYDDENQYTRFLLSPSGRLAITHRDEDGLKFWSVRQGKLAPLGPPIRFTSPLIRIQSLTITPDERHLLLATQNCTTAVLRLDPTLSLR